MSKTKNLPKLKKIKKVLQTKWLHFSTLYYDNHVSWEMASRPTHVDGKAEVVLIVPIDRKLKKILVTKEFRYTVGEEVIDLPAGMIDGEDSVEYTAMKELREEVGYKGKIEKILPPSYSSVGLTNELLSVVFMNVDSENDFIGSDLENNEIISGEWLTFDEAKKLATSGVPISGRAQLILDFLQ